MPEPTVLAAGHVAAGDVAGVHVAVGDLSGGYVASGGLAADYVAADHFAADYVAADYFQAYSVVGLLAVIGVLFVAVAFGAGRLLRPVVPTPEKLLTYECGVDPVGEGWAHTQVRYYVYAFLYVIFAVDSIFLFPWATVFAAPGYGATTLVEMFIFLGFLAVGLLYAYKKGVLTWA
ncbi:NAD(P)H-quinone oxidoreductase subunit 3 [Streptomyces jeddahensis]|uniref:NADH-quinone oxidoreductase subunit n=1 Tax=Streptomyces jeddahensis TaxID=1716141 RepID=A0A177HLK7_9ACTN|nr:NAD(P)H-quinone oxidoreductase subunit 3 [Streptomyces jeddahensis]